MSRILVTARAYERRDDLGGGFRGVAYDPATKERRTSDVLPTLAAARNAAKKLAYDMIGADAWGRTRPGYIWGKRTWTCNYWGN